MATDNGYYIDAHTPFNVVRRQAIIGFKKPQRVIHAFVALVCLAEITISGELANRAFPDLDYDWFNGKRAAPIKAMTTSPIKVNFIERRMNRRL